MAQTFQATRVQDDSTFDYTPGTAVVAGQVVPFGQRCGIAARPIAASALGALETEGIYDVVKANELMNTDGAAIYWDADGNPYNGTAGTGCATASAGGNTFLGFLIGTALATAETCRVQVIGVPAVTATIYNSLAASVADPGNAGAIAVTNSGTCQIVTTGAETRTLAVPTFAGQQLLLAMKTDGGDCVVTVADPHIDGTNNTITLNDAGDSVLLMAAASGAGYIWRLVVNVGATLSHV